MAFGRFGFASLDDDQPTEFWMDDRTDQVAQRDAFDTAGRERWDASTRPGENLDARRPSDVVALGAPATAVATPDGAATQGTSADPPTSGVAGDQSDAAATAPGGPTVRYVKARAGHNIIALVGSSEPGAVGAFARLNGMDGRNSTIYAGRVYAIPTGNDVASPEDATLGGRLMQHDDARVAALRAQRAANDQFQARFDANQDVWTGRPIGAGLPAHRPPSAPSPVPSQGQPWWESEGAKRVGGSLAYAAGTVWGAPTAVYHAAGDAKDAGLFGLQWAGAFGPEAQAQANGRAADFAHGVAHYARVAIDDPSRVVSDAQDAAGKAIDNVSPFNADMFRLPAGLNDGKGWRPKELGLTKYGRAERIWKGMSVPLKDGLAAIPFLDAPALYGELEQPQ